MHRAWAEINASALLHNLALVKQHSRAQIIAVIKANAYGHGMAFIAKTLAPHVSAFAVASLDEAKTLRALLNKKQAKHEILCLSGFYAAEQIPYWLEFKITPVIFNLEQISWLEAFGQFNAAVYLKIDTGMGRLGIDAKETTKSIKRLESLGAKVSLMSHFASADEESPQNEAQHLRFKTAAGSHQQTKSFANSAAILRRPQDHYDAVRPGIMLYGSTPLKGISAKALNLQAVMRVYARLLVVKQLKTGQCVGYGAYWRAKEACYIGIVAFGYADGYPRIVSKKAMVAIAGKRYNIIGRISMDSMAILLDADGKASAENMHIGDAVELWGETISIDEVASWADTIGYEIMCGLSSRVTKIKHVN